MNISYVEPLSLAWNRMKRMLFRPFHIETWLVTGFAVFLARLFTHTGSGSSWNLDRGRPRLEIERGVDRVRESMAWLANNPVVLFAIIGGLVILCVLVLVLAWVSARAEFVFLDNVAKGRGEFVAPWRRLGRLGHSLFLWRALFSFAYLPVLVLIVMPFVGVCLTLLGGGDFEWPQLSSIVLGVGSGLLLLMVVSWVALLTNDFVVPLMYRYEENVTNAWRRFLPLLTQRLGSFIAYAVFLVVVAITVGIALLIAGVGTCCIGLVLMVAPYIGSVVLLPVHVTARALGPEFLAQFGPEWTIFTPAEEPEDVAPRPVV